MLNYRKYIQNFSAGISYQIEGENLIEATKPVINVIITLKFCQGQHKSVQSRKGVANEMHMKGAQKSMLHIFAN